MNRVLYVIAVVVTVAGSAHSQAPEAGSAGPQTTGAAGYGSEAYGGRAEIFISAFGLLSGDVTGNSIQQGATTAAGGAAGYRLRLNKSSAIEGRYGFSRNSQKYTIGGATTSVPTYLSDITGSYVYSFPKRFAVTPFLEAGGGILRFSPGNYGNGPDVSNPDPAANGGGPYAGIPGYPQASGSGSNSTGLPAQIRPTFVYGGGFEVPLSSHFIVRAEYRGLAFKQPDFKQAGLQTGAFGVLSEPTISFAWRF